MNEKIVKAGKQLVAAFIVVAVILGLAVALGGGVGNLLAGYSNRTPKGQVVADARTLLAALAYIFRPEGTLPIQPATGQTCDSVAGCLPTVAPVYPSNRTEWQGAPSVRQPACI